MNSDGYISLFQSLPQPYILFKTDAPSYTFVDVSRAHSSMTQVSRSKLIGRSFFDVFPDTSIEFKTSGKSPIEIVFEKVIRTKKPVALKAFRYDIPDHHGNYIEKYWEPIHYPIIDSNNNVTHILQLSKDVSDEIDVSEKLVKTKRDLDNALDIGLLAVWNWDIEKGIITGSKNLSIFYGVNSEDVTNGFKLEQFANTIYVDDRDRVIHEMSKAVERKGLFESEYRTIDSKGSMRWVIARGQIEKDQDNKPIRLPGIVVDVTKLKQAEFNAKFIADASRVLAGSLDYRLTLNQVAQLAVPSIADWCSISLLKNASSLEQIAVAHKDPQKVKWARAFSSSQRAEHSGGMGAEERVMRSGKSEYYPKITQKMLESGTTSHAQLKIATDLAINSLIIAPLHDQSQQIGSITVILTDGKRSYTKDDLILIEELAERISLAITNARLYELSQSELSQRKKLQDELKNYNIELESKVVQRTSQLNVTNESLRRSNEELENFAYVASHDLQEPLRKIQAFGDILSDEFAQKLGDGNDYLLRMQAAASRMSTLIDDLLSFSRVTTHAKPFIRVDLNNTYLNVIEDLSNRIEKVDGKVTSDNLPVIYGDDTQLRQLLQNLIGNALKFHTPNESPVVHVGCYINNNKYVISVSDNGIGIDEKYSDKIFAVFQRLHGRDEFEGTGIGLAVCKKIVERHGGTISLTSRPGQGTTFVVSLPMNYEPTGGSE